MAGGYFKDGTVDIELGSHAFATPRAVRPGVILSPHRRPAVVLDAGGGVLDMQVTGRRLRQNLGDAERYLYERLHSLGTSDPGRLGCRDDLGRRATFGSSVCVGAVGRVEAFRFAELRLRFYSPEKSAEPAWESAPAPPAPYPGTDTLRDYAAGDVTIGHHPVGMELEMTRRYPMRRIPRARGTRPRGPRRGAQIRFVIRAHARVAARNLGDYLEELARQIGPRPVELTANGNIYRDVLLERLEPAHTDLRHTGFEAEFVMSLGSAVTCSTTAAPTTTTTTSA